MFSLLKKLLLFPAIFTLLACSGPSDPNLAGPFLNKQDPPNSAVKAQLNQWVRMSVANCYQDSTEKKDLIGIPFPKYFGHGANPFEIKIWHKGNKIYSSLSPGGLIAKALKKKISQICKQLKDFSFKPEDIAQIEYQFSFAYDFQDLEDSNYRTKRRKLTQELGLWGLLSTPPKKDSRWVFPSTITEKNRKYKEVFEDLCGKGIPPKECLGKLSGHLKKFETLSFLLIPEAPGYLDLFRNAPIVPIQNVNEDSIKSRMMLMRNWYLNNIAPSGEMTYLYRPTFAKRSRTHNNMIRQFMTTLALFRLAKHLKDPVLLNAAEKNLNFNLRKYMKVDEDNKIAFIYFRQKAKLGAAAFALMSLLESKKHPDRAKLLEYFTSFILQMQRPSGEFNTFFLPKSRNDNQNFYPGEALLALMTLYQKNPQKHRSLPGVVEKAFHYYRDFFRQQPNPAFVPWHTMALVRLYRVKPKQKIADFIFEMNDFLIEIQNTPKEIKTPEPDTLGRFYDPKKRKYGPPHASSTAIYTEGLIDALKLAILLKDTKHQENYRYSILWGIRSLFQLQYTKGNSFYIPDKKAILGAIHTTVANNNIRVDNTQHATMAFLNLLTAPKAIKSVLKTQ